LNQQLAQFLRNYISTLSELPVSQLPHPRHLSRRFSPEQLDALGEGYEAGATAAELAAVVGVSKSALLELLHARGVPVRTRPSLSETEVDEAERLYAGGLLLREIGARFCVSRDCVRLALKRRGVKLRPGLGARRS
jgi:hypothetical protein